ncbi:G_PROTEIN_RECEP_F1_2 domain-containing protein [Meloidogyne graminicola]|uniref:G_PROTEIN_RECEP_F1_2 domain-containing protein n=1 Tax=Meloidogyne graminicola TaxID=189291 RepID=A0A8S9ZDW5_9BILA|nr:G_PROTEIN_RECEP_F1_2 domain-containing protein [Meloidogyne graminicola]
MENSTFNSTEILLEFYDNLNKFKKNISIFNEEEYNNKCNYEGTDYLDVKIILIGVFASSIALISFILNSFLVLVFALNPKLRQSPLYYFSVLAILDLALAILYILLMAVPVYMDQFKFLWLYHLFISYLRPMLTLSNFAMFASVLMILLATTERLLLTFEGKQIKNSRKILERNRPQVTLLVMSITVAYKLCTYFEVEVAEHKQCKGFAQFEVISAVYEESINPLFKLVGSANYKFWWMFFTRNLIDHIFPFFLLIILNFCIIRALRKESKKIIYNNQNLILKQINCLKHDSFCYFCSFCNITTNQGQQPINFNKINENYLKTNKKCLKNKKNSINKTEDNQTQKKNLRAATRALISVVSMYLMSKVLQVVVTFFETFDSETISDEKFRKIYSYANDVISILTLLSSALRFPVYCACNKPMFIATKATLNRIFHRSTISVPKKKRKNNCSTTSSFSSLNSSISSYIRSGWDNNPPPLLIINNNNSLQKKKLKEKNNENNKKLIIKNKKEEKEKENNFKNEINFEINTKLIIEGKVFISNLEEEEEGKILDNEEEEEELFLIDCEGICKLINLYFD